MQGLASRALSSMRRVSSVDPSSTTMMSSSRYVWTRTLSMAWMTRCARLYVGMTTETFGLRPGSPALLKGVLWAPTNTRDRTLRFADEQSPSGPAEIEPSTGARGDGHCEVAIVSLSRDRKAWEGGSCYQRAHRTMRFVDVLGRDDGVYWV